MTIELVRANINDTRVLAAIHITAWKEAYKNIIPKSYLDTLSIDSREQNFRNDMLTKNNLEFYIVKDSLNDIGIVILTTDNDKHTGQITALYLLEHYHHKGIGSIVMNYIKTRFINENYYEIRLWVLKDNTKAILFYKKNNFICTGNINSIVCGKELKETEFKCQF